MTWPAVETLANLKIKFLSALNEKQNAQLLKKKKNKKFYLFYYSYLNMLKLSIG